MQRLLKTILLLLAPSVLFAWLTIEIPEVEETGILFVSIFAGIISYGYLVMPDDEFDSKGRSPVLLAYAFAVAGITTIFRLLLDGRRAHHFPVQSMIICGGWGLVVLYVLARTRLLRSSRSKNREDEL